MDKKTAKVKLRELRDSLSKVLDEKEFQSSEEIKEQSKEALGQARQASKQFKKTLVGKNKRTSDCRQSFSARNGRDCCS